MVALWDSHRKFPEGTWHYSVAPHNLVILGGASSTPFKNCLGVGFERAAGKDRGPRHVDFPPWGGSQYTITTTNCPGTKIILIVLLYSGQVPALQTSNHEL